ncbi:MAG: ABC transporter substrate-binding protein [Bacillota bacterium]
MKKFIIVFLAAFLIFGIFSGVGEAQTPDDALVIAAPTEIFISLDPGVCYEVLPSRVVDAVYDQLVGWKNVDESLEIVPELAESWDISEDRMTYTFHLKDAQFSNGDPVTAEDVVWSYKRYLQMEKPSVWLLESIGINKDNADEMIELIDDKSLSLTFDKPYAENIVLGIMTNNWGSVINKEVALSHEVDGDLGEGWLTDNSAGAGQYVLDAWERNTMVTMSANEYYHGEEPKLERIMIRDVPESSNQRLLLERGDVDIAWDLTPQQLSEVEGREGVEVIEIPAHSNEYLAMNASWGPLQDVRVRQAIKYAINYDEIIDDIMAGYAMKVQGFVPKGYFGYVDRNPFNQDIEKAKELLAEAGYPDGFEVEILTNQTDTRKGEATKVQADLELVGIDATVTVMQASQMYGKYREQGHQMIVAGWGNDYADADNLAMAFASHEAGQLAWRNAWYDDHAAELAEEGRFEPDPTKREEIYEELTDYWFENGPFAMFYQSVETWAISDQLENFYPSAFGYSMTFDFGGISK